MVSNFKIVQDFILTGFFFIISGLPSAALSAKKKSSTATTYYISHRVMDGKIIHKV
jgi:hypothetical protein